MASRQHDVSRERALAHDSRVALVKTLRLGSRGLDVRELAETVGLHVNTVRSHLALLERAGLVHRHAEPRKAPGRPRQLYTAAVPDVPAEGEGDDRYQLLARMLASYVATLDDPAAAAEETGRQWGRQLVRIPEPFAASSPGQATELLIQVLDELGFQPRYGATPSEIELRHCPFRDVAEVHPEVACSLHLGLMRGAMAQVDAPLSVEDLMPFVDPGRCLTHVSPSPYS